MRKIPVKLLLRALLVVCCFSVITPSFATENGSTHYIPGAIATLIDLAPTQPGWVAETAYLHYEADASASRRLPVAGEVVGGLNARMDALLFGGFYTLDQTLLGARYTVGGFLPYVWMDVKGRIDTPRRSISRSDSVSGIGDIILLPAMLAWEKDYWQFNALLPIYAPSGRYKEGRLANTGLNYWTFDPTVGVSYNNDQNGFNAALHTGLSFNTENSETDYRSGNQLHLEASLQQLLPLGPGFLGVGTEAFYLQQISGDSGAGAVNGDFKGHTVGVGPVLNYFLPGSNGNLLAELRWLPELGVKRRLEGDYVWAKVVYQF